MFNKYISKSANYEFVFIGRNNCKLRLGNITPKIQIKATLNGDAIYN